MIIRSGEESRHLIVTDALQAKNVDTLISFLEIGAERNSNLCHVDVVQRTAKRNCTIKNYNACEGESESKREIFFPEKS